VFPFIDTAPRASRPVVVLGLIAANVLVFLWMRSLPPRMLEATLVHYALIPVRYTDPQLAISSSTCGSCGSSARPWRRGSEGRASSPST
jgi:hypothetical protein